MAKVVLFKEYTRFSDNTSSTNQGNKTIKTQVIVA